MAKSAQQVQPKWNVRLLKQHIHTVLLLTLLTTSAGFAPLSSHTSQHLRHLQNDECSFPCRQQQLGISATRDRQQEKSSSESSKKSARQKRNKKAQGLTIRELTNEVLANPAKYIPEGKSKGAQNRKKKSNYRRTRKRVDNPKQTYVYAKQRRALEGQRTGSHDASGGDDDDELDDSYASSESMADPIQTSMQKKRQIVADLVKELDIKPSTQHCDPTSDFQQPKILGKVFVGDEEDQNSSSAFAYLIDKPAGWAILGSKTSTQNRDTQTAQSLMGDNEQSNTKKKQQSTVQRVKVQDEDGSIDFLEYNEQDVFSLMTEEELQQFLEEGGELPPGITMGQGSSVNRLTPSSASTTPIQRVEAVDDDGNVEHFEYSEQDVFDLMTAEEIEEFLEEGGEIPPGVTIEGITTNHPGTATTQQQQYQYDNAEDNAARQENIRRIQARASQGGQRRPAAFATSANARPSVVAWLKETQEAQTGRIIRGGKFWKAIAGATNVDDSGVVLLCPKSAVDRLFVDSADYVAVVGNGGHFVASSASPKLSNMEAAVLFDDIAKLKKAREEDVVETARITIPEQQSTCDHVVKLCQEEYLDGIRGDPLAHPLDRHSTRRLIHCQSMIVSSLVHDEDAVEAETSPKVPDDIAILSERRNQLAYNKGSFLGRQSLRKDPATTAYREMNGAADGFPGWTVDRYDKWLLVQHDPDYPRGPLPSIHDGYTSGVYYLEARQDRSSMGSQPQGLASTSDNNNNRPRLLEGQAAPDIFPIKENGIQYMVSLDRDLSTGIFLDQRPQRNWLRRNCGPGTRVLNCFAHTGAFSVAAAAAGASTVSVDLSKKWLDRLPQHFEANGMEFDENHDAIYGDCFDWLARLAKRGETFDIVILDPPSASVGGRKKKRWSVKNDMDELVALASKLVNKKGGLLWTTTNNAGMPASRFARLCKKGLEGTNAKLERTAPMPVDFPTIGPHNVKNLVWRFPL